MAGYFVTEGFLGPNSPAAIVSALSHLLFVPDGLRILRLSCNQ